MEYYPEDLDMIGAAEAALAATMDACATLHQYGCADDIIEDANTDVELLNALLEEANFAKREANTGKKAIIKRYNIVN